MPAMRRLAARVSRRPADQRRLVGRDDYQLNIEARVTGLIERAPSGDFGGLGRVTSARRTCTYPSVSAATGSSTRSELFRTQSAVVLDDITVARVPGRKLAAASCVSAAISAIVCASRWRSCGRQDRAGALVADPSCRVRCLQTSEASSRPCCGTVSTTCDSRGSGMRAESSYTSYEEGLGSDETAISCDSPSTSP